MKSWVESANAPDCDFPLQNLPFGVFSTDGARRCGLAIGEFVLDLAALEASGKIDAGGTFSSGSLNSFMALGSKAWARVRARLTELLAVGGDPSLPLVPMAMAQLHLPFTVTEYTDFYASRNHAFNLGTLFRGPDNALPPNWLHMPIGYNGRASSIIVSGTPIRRPMGQLKRDTGPIFAPSERLDFELELGAVIGTGSTMGNRVSVDQAEEMIFGYVLLNDWTSRDVQGWEYQPLGPFQSKALATTISPWIVTSAALEPFRTPTPTPEKPLLPYLQPSRPGLYDIALSVELNEATISRTNYKVMYYSSAQQLAHHTSSGCPMRVGDLLGTGTISGPSQDGLGSLMEMTTAGAHSITLPDGSSRTFLADGDRLTLRGHAQGSGYRIGFGACTGTILAAEA